MACETRLMNPSDLPLFDLLDHRLAWLNSRQGILSQNVANADTPGYVARDLPPFASVLHGAVMAPAVTNPMHLTPLAAAPAAQATNSERAPDGNGVRLDEQLTQIADTDGAHELATTLYHKYLGLFRIAIGK